MPLQVLIFLGLPLRSLLRAAEHTRGIFVGFVAATVFSITAVIPLLRSFGLAGVLLVSRAHKSSFSAFWHCTHGGSSPIQHG